ncbi:MAG: zinc metalloprotease HtpX [Bdellovibrionales bacterium RBG_16_40_8]|nr:MAG: zinc metalloprotease HtpX [Bdellovibrionales bacterium RBG_16_40_8]
MWTMTKRMMIFVTVNILILISLSLALNLICAFLGINPNQYYQSLLLISITLGFGGAFTSLLLSKFMAKTMMGVQIVDPKTTDPALRHLVQKIYEFSRAAKLKNMPEVGIYNSPEVNAFATGPSKNNSLVAVSTGLLRTMNTDATEGVIAHEITHIANGDMVTMTLIQGVINSIVIFAARIIAHIIVNQGRSSNDSRPNPFLYFGLVMALEILFSLFGMIAVNYFSRWREYRADAGGAKYAGRDKMISALRALQKAYNQGPLDTDDQRKNEAIATFKISGRPRKNKFIALFATHPQLEDRIRRLETGR